jgi:hypothetical protein
MSRDIIKIPSAVIKQELAGLVEKLIKWHLINHKTEYTGKYFGTYGGGVNMKIGVPRPMTTKDGMVNPLMGDLTKKHGICEILGWHGDLAFVINSRELGKVAIIFEVKFGRCHISKPQHKFFQKIVAEPSKYMDGLKQIKIIIVKAREIDIDNNEIAVEFDEYKNKNEVK